MRVTLSKQLLNREPEDKKFDNFSEVFLTNLMYKKNKKTMIHFDVRFLIL